MFFLILEHTTTRKRHPNTGKKTNHKIAMEISHCGRSRKWPEPSPRRGATTRLGLDDFFQSHFYHYNDTFLTIIAHIPLLSAVSVKFLTSSTILLYDSHSLLHFLFEHISKTHTLVHYFQPANERSIQRHFVPFTANDDEKTAMAFVINLRNVC